MKLVQEEEVIRKTVDRREPISSEDEPQDTLEVSLIVDYTVAFNDKNTPRQSEIFSIEM